MVALLGEIEVVDVILDSAEAPVLNGAKGMALATVEGDRFLYVGGRGDSAIQILSLSNSGEFSPVGEFYNAPGINLQGVEDLVFAAVGEGRFIVSITAQGVSVFSIGDGGLLTNTVNVNGSNLNNGDAVATVALDGQVYLIGGGQSGDGMNVYRMQEDGGLTETDAVNDSAPGAPSTSLQLNGLLDIATAVYDGQGYVLAVGGQDQGLSVFQISDDGLLTNTDNVNDDDSDSLRLSGVASVTTARVNGTDYVFAGGTEGISVLTLSATGTLTEVFGLDNSAAPPIDSSFSAQDLEIFRIGGEAFLAAPTFGDSLSIFAIGAGGDLTQVGLFDNDDEVTLDDPQQVEIVRIGGQTLIAVSGRSDDGVTLFDVAGGDNVLIGTPQGDALVGGAGNDTIEGRSSGDKLIGGAGQDVLRGENGNDGLVGGPGADILDGGKGRDVASYQTSAGGVTVNLQTGLASGAAAQGDSFIRIEDVEGSNFADNLSGNVRANRLYGNNGTDTLYGGAGRDSLFGGRGADDIRGGAGNDVMRGAGGADKLTGAQGNDTLYGGGGPDRFVFLPNQGDDEIRDFERGADRIVLRTNPTLPNFDVVLDAAEDDGDDVVIASGSGSIRLIGLSEADLSESDFLFRV